MPVSSEKWAKEIREQHRRVCQWEPWQRDKGRPDPASEWAEDPGDDDWVTMDEPECLKDALKEARELSDQDAS